jgi:hypothetical protein
MVISINQPSYLPWLGYYDRIKKSDIHVILDSVQFEKNSVTNRNKVRIPSGWCWLTVPLKTKGHFGNLRISDLEISNNLAWEKKHWETIRINYSKAPYYKDHITFFEKIYSVKWERLNDINSAINEYFLNILGIKTQIFRSTNLPITEKKNALVLNICKHFGATTYISGPFGKHYLDLATFEKEKIKVVFHEYKCKEYKQVFPNFEPNLSAIDDLFNCGIQCLP